MCRHLLLLACIALISAASAQVPEPKALASDAPDRVFTDRLKTISAQKGGHAIDCGITTANHPENSVAVCGQTAFEQHTPFFLGYETLFRDLAFAYGMAGDAKGGVFVMSYQGRGYPPVPLNRHMQLMDDNHTRVMECFKPVTLEITARGLLACTTPVNQEESEKAAGQKPLDTTVCTVLANPAAFNNKIVRIRGHYSGNFEYSELSGDGCDGSSLWFGYGGGSGPPNLAAYASTGNINPGSEDSEGRRVLPVPVNLIRDSKFERFEKAVRSFPSNHGVVPLIGGAPEPKFVTATFIGRIDAVSTEVHEFLKKQPAERRIGLGFGQMGQFEAQFILQSVEDDATME
jgi:hypothetical protein